MTALIPRDRVDSRWLYYWVLAHGREFQRRAAGNTFKEVARSKIRAIPMEVPSVSEQERIARVLDGFTTAIEAHADHAKAARALRNVIGAEAWEASGWAALGDLAPAITGQTPSTKRPEFWSPEEVPFVTPGDFDGSLFIRKAAAGSRQRELPSWGH